LGNATGGTLGSSRRPILAPADGTVSGRGAAVHEVHGAARFSWRGVRTCLHHGGTPGLNSRYGERPRPTRARNWNPQRTGGHRRARMAARARTPRVVGVDFKGLGVLPASGRSDLGTAQADPDVEATVRRARACWSAGAQVASRSA
jgi:hypothetical protein